MEIHNGRATVDAPLGAKQVRARSGMVVATGDNAAQATGALIDAIHQQLALGFTRAYACEGSVTLAMHYFNGWCYDVIDGGRVVGTCSIEASSDLEAAEAMSLALKEYVHGSESLT